MSHVTLSRGCQPSAQSSVWFWFRSCFSAFRPEIKHFRIYLETVPLLCLNISGCKIRILKRFAFFPQERSSQKQMSEASESISWGFGVKHQKPFLFSSYNMFTRVTYKIHIKHVNKYNELLGINKYK